MQILRMHHVTYANRGLREVIFLLNIETFLETLPIPPLINSQYWLLRSNYPESRFYNSKVCISKLALSKFSPAILLSGHI